MIGEVKGKPEKRNDGIWWRIVLDKASKFARRIWEAARNGMAAASSGSIAHLVRVARDGEILRWPLGEIALIDTEGKRQPANHFAVALPVMAKLYKDAGRDLPALPEAETVQEADGVSAVSKPEATFKTQKEFTDMDEKDITKIVGMFEYVNPDIDVNLGNIWDSISRTFSMYNAGLTPVKNPENFSQHEYFNYYINLMEKYNRGDTDDQHDSTDLSLAVIGHTHSARLVKRPKDDRFYYLMDCGSWVNGGHEFGVISGPDMAVCQWG